MSDALRSKVCAYMVTDSRGNSALLRDRMRAETYVTHVIGGQVDGLVRLSDALEAVAVAGCRRDSDEKGA